MWWSVWRFVRDFLLAGFTLLLAAATLSNLAAVMRESTADKGPHFVAIFLFGGLAWAIGRRACWYACGDWCGESCEWEEEDEDDVIEQKTAEGLKKGKNGKGK